MSDEKALVINDKPKDRRFFSAALFTLLLIGVSGTFGYLMPGYDPSTADLFPYWEQVVYMAGPMICMIYYIFQTKPLAMGEVGSISAVADDAMLSMLPYVPIGVTFLLWGIMPEFSISIFLCAQFLFATVVITMDVFLNGRIGATVNRLVQEWKRQH